MPYILCLKYRKRLTIHRKCIHPWLTSGEIYIGQYLFGIDLSDLYNYTIVYVGWKRWVGEANNSHILYRVSRIVCYGNYKTTSYGRVNSYKAKLFLLSRIFVYYRITLRGYENNIFERQLLIFVYYRITLRGYENNIYERQLLITKQSTCGHAARKGWSCINNDFKYV